MGRNIFRPAASVDRPQEMSQAEIALYNELNEGRDLQKAQETQETIEHSGRDLTEGERAILSLCEEIREKVGKNNPA